MDTNDALVSYARTFLGVPYIWGGNNRLTGLDCSGLVCEVLRSFGIVGHFEDLNCDMLYTKLVRGTTYGPSAVKFHPEKTFAGEILFFGENLKELHHVAIAVDNCRMIEAGGGDRRCVLKDTAERLGAMVRERMVSGRKDLVSSISISLPAVYGQSI